MARIKLRRNFSFSSIDLKPTQSAMREEAVTLRDRIVQRTQSGLDENNRKFAPYQGGGRRTVDLTDTGQMLEQDFQPVSVTRNRFGLGFRTFRSEQIADAHITGKGKLPVRAFLGVPASWVNAIKKRLLTSVKLSK